jgi:hypothetical protein
MKYIEYTELVFKRTDLNSSIFFEKTGYDGFVLTKKLQNNHLIEVSSAELQNPKLFIKKRNSDTYHIIPISPEAVIDFLHDGKNKIIP